MLMPPPLTIEEDKIVEKEYKETREKDVQQVQEQEEQNEMEPTKVSTLIPITTVVPIIPITRCVDNEERNNSFKMGRGLEISKMIIPWISPSSAR